MNRTPARFWDLPSAAILISILLTSSQGLYDTHWAAGLGSAVLLALAGVVLGLALGFSRFKRATITWFSCGYSLPIVTIVLAWFLSSGVSWMARVAGLSNRLAVSLGLFLTSHPVKDTVLFVVFMGLVFWIIGLMAGYAFTRFGNFAGAVVPAGVVLVIIQLYGAGRAGNSPALVIYLLLCLIELGRMTYATKRLFWKEQHVSVLSGSGTELNIAFIIVACVTLMLVWLAPTSAKSFSDIKTAWDNFSHPLRGVQTNLGNAVAGLQGGETIRHVQFYGDVLALGSQAATGDTVYFKIQPPDLNGVERYYWRVRSYDDFFNGQWYTTIASNTAFIPDQSSISLADPQGLVKEFEITSLLGNLAVLVTPARPVWVSHPAELFFLQVPEGKMDPVQFRSDPTVSAGEKYSVRADIISPTIMQLRSAGNTYPGWVTRIYLQLPDNLPADITALAQRITRREQTPYDMAASITQYLRSAITYSGTVENPPPGRDALEWFLFDSKKGFCNYYATAEVLMLRSVGIPARMVVGFAQGEFEQPNLYVIHARDAHAWPEVYFPGVGWVEYEPTSNQAALVRPLGQILTAGGQPTSTAPVGTAGQGLPGQPTPIQAGGTLPGSGSLAPVNWILGLILICAIIVTLLRIVPAGTFEPVPESDQPAGSRALPVVLKHFFEQRGLTPPGWLLRWAYLAGLNPVERSFVTVYRSLHWLDGQPGSAQTPAEAAAALARRLPKVSKEIDALLQEYQNQLYGQIHGRILPARSAAKVIRQAAVRAAIQQRWSTLRGIFRPDHP